MSRITRQRPPVVACARASVFQAPDADDIVGPGWQIRHPVYRRALQPDRRRLIESYGESTSDSEKVVGSLGHVSNPCAGSRATCPRIIDDDGDPYVSLT